jgi:hypothetical protein
MSFLKKLWAGWMIFAEKFGHFMSGVILTVLYVTVLLPYGILMRLFSDPLAMKGGPKDTNWKSLEKKSHEIEPWRKQY